jgi:hypothetical protein
MTLIDAVIVSGIVAAFVLFTVVLAWGEYQTRGLSRDVGQKPSGGDEPRRGQGKPLHKAMKLRRIAANTSRQRFETFRVGIIAGAAGGLAEIAWVLLYAAATGGDPAVLARGITAAAGAGVLLPAASPVMLGIGVHMTLALMLGIILTFIWRALPAKRADWTNAYPFMLAALVGVWATNFFVVLPIVSPAFVHMVPYAISLISKLLFGVAAAEVVRNQALFAAPSIALARSRFQVGETSWN